MTEQKKKLKILEDKNSRKVPDFIKNVSAQWSSRKKL